MLLAAGFGGRLAPITFFRAKPALPFLNRPLLLRQLDHLSAAGVDEVVVNLHHRPASVLDLLARAESEDADDPAPGQDGPDGTAAGFDLPEEEILQAAWGPFRLGSLTVHVCLEPEILGTSGGLNGAAAHFAGGETFLCLNADFICDVDLRAVVAAHRRSGGDATLVLRPDLEGDRFTPVWHDSHRVLAFGPAPEGSPGAGAACEAAVFTGIHVLEPGILERLPPGRSDFLPALYRPMIAGNVCPAVFLADAAWYEVGTPDRYLDAQVELLPAGRIGSHRPWDARLAASEPAGRSPGTTASRADAGTSVVDSDRQVLTGAGCHVDPEASLGPGTIIGAGVTVGAHARIERSVIMDRALVGEDARLRDVIVGPDTAVPPRVELARAVVEAGRAPGSIPSPKRTAHLWEGLWRADF